MKRFLILFILMAFGLSLVACNNQESDDNRNNEMVQLSERVYVKKENGENNESIGEIKVNEIIEEKYEEMVLLPDPLHSTFVSYQPGFPIIVNYPDANAIYEISIDNGTLTYYGQEKAIEIPNGVTIHWYNDRSENEKPHTYIDIIVKIENQIVGYSIIEIERVDIDNCLLYQGNILKSSIFPKVNGKNQNLTSEQIEQLIVLAKEKK